MSEAKQKASRFKQMTEWAGKCQENDSGYLAYSAIHAWSGARALCGANEPRGEWVAEEDSPKDRGKRCQKRAEASEE